MNEFDLIARYFTRPARQARLGVGDDAALLAPTPGQELVVAADMLVEGRHFLATADPYGLGHKALAVNLSDLAAMGATPRWVLLALALPAAEASWLERFAAGFFALADAHAVDLVGGDTTRGPRNLCVTVLGEAPTGQALRRSGAQVGDQIWVSGELGAAALGLRHLLGEATLGSAAAAACQIRLDRPTPRVELGLLLRGLAHAAIDISDGLLADLGHLLAQSGVGAEVEFAALPAAPALATCADAELAQHCLLAGGDDYELCFTAPPTHAAAIEAAGAELHLPVRCIGAIVAPTGLRLRDIDGHLMQPAQRGYDHFQ